MKNESGGVAIKECVGLKPKIYLLLVSWYLEYKQAKIVNRNVIATISHGEYKDVLMNKKSLSHLLNWIQSKDRRIGTYEINKISLSYFDEKNYIQNNG